MCHKVQQTFSCNNISDLSFLQLTFIQQEGFPKHPFYATLKRSLCYSDIHVGKRTLHQHRMHRKYIYSIFTWKLLYPLLSPDAVICCSYFINVLLTIIGLKAAKLHIINCNKWKAWGYIYCSMVALPQLWNWFRTKNTPNNRGYLWF